jgi:hypothetical protein
MFWRAAHVDPRRDGSWSAQITWTRTADENFIDTFRADDVRPLALT